MEMHLHDTKTLYTKILQVDHGLEPQVVLSGDGRGTYTIVEGHGVIHKVILEFVKLDIVWRVVCSDGYLMITVSDPRRWNEIAGELHQLAARHIPEKKRDPKRDAES